MIFLLAPAVLVTLGVLAYFNFNKDSNNYNATDLQKPNSQSNTSPASPASTLSLTNPWFKVAVDVDKRMAPSGVLSKKNAQGKTISAMSTVRRTIRNAGTGKNVTKNVRRDDYQKKTERITFRTNAKNYNTVPVTKKNQTRERTLLPDATGPMHTVPSGDIYHVENLKKQQDRYENANHYGDVLQDIVDNNANVHGIDCNKTATLSASNNSAINALIYALFYHKKIKNYFINKNNSSANDNIQIEINNINQGLVKNTPVDFNPIYAELQAFNNDYKDISLSTPKQILSLLKKYYQLPHVTVETYVEDIHTNQLSNKKILENDIDFLTINVHNELTQNEEGFIHNAGVADQDEEWVEKQLERFKLYDFDIKKFIPVLDTSEDKYHIKMINDENATDLLGNEQVLTSAPLLYVDIDRTNVEDDVALHIYPSVQLQNNKLLLKSIICYLDNKYYTYYKCNKTWYKYDGVKNITPMGTFKEMVIDHISPTYYCVALIYVSSA